MPILDQRRGEGCPAGTPLTSNCLNADVPALDAAYLQARDDIADPIGVKGLGEVVMVGVPGAIVNATGKRVTDLPITVKGDVTQLVLEN
jgi:hypothetical protein